MENFIVRSLAKRKSQVKDSASSHAQFDNIFGRVYDSKFDISKCWSLLFAGKASGEQGYIMVGLAIGEKNWNKQ
jgi:hypothetical protein